MQTFTNPLYKIYQKVYPPVSLFSYLISNNDGSAAIIDPLTDPSPYLQFLKDNNLVLKFILETHFHADFLSNSKELAKKADCPIFGGNNLLEKQRISLGDIYFEVIKTPGHTLDSVCYLLKDNKDQATHIFTGDTVFIGEVGRPDLATSSEIKKEDLAEMLFYSIHNKIMQLDDHLVILPAHGAGSSCGKNIGKGNSTTILEQKMNNWAFLETNKEIFVRTVSDIMKPPMNFHYNAELNKSGFNDYEFIEKKSNIGITKEELKDIIVNQKVNIVDFRPNSTIGVKNALFIPNEMNIENFIGHFLHPKDPLVIVTENDESSIEIISRLIKIGYLDIIGYLKGGFKEIEQNEDFLHNLSDIEPSQLKNDLNIDNDIVLDVRNPGEWAEGVLKTAQLIALPNLKSDFEILDRNKTIYVHCKSGMRGKIAESFLKSKGFDKVYNVIGGRDKMAKNGFEFNKKK